MVPVSRLFAALVSVALIGCEREASTALDAAPITPAFAHDRGEWTVPVHLGPEVNSSSRELGPALSPDELSLYYNSDRVEGGLGSFDIWVSRRSCRECPWEPARNLGPPINGPDNGGAASLSHDGHLLFFLSDRLGTLGGEDLWVSRRKNPNDDFGWESPVNLGPLVNTGANEGSPSYVVAAAGAHAELYFERGLTTWVAPISRDGEVLAPAVQVDFGGDARSPSVRKDGRELVFWAAAGRGGFGATDIWVSTRLNLNDSWSMPVNLGAPVNTAGGELEAAISADGNTLVFSGTMTRGSSLGLQDIWIATRTHR
jgi:hypothetical protein